MALESLAPDQRAVVQLVLQQGRSYAALAGLLGISEDAVRQRAHAGLATLGAGSSLDPAERGLVADFLLGQQDDDERRRTASLLSDSEPARTWALTVADELAPVARQGLPEIPGGEAATRVQAPEPRRAAEDLDAPRRARPEAAEDLDAPRRARPEPEARSRPQRDADGDAADGVDLSKDDEPAASRRRRRRGGAGDDAPASEETGDDAPRRARREPARAGAATRPRRERQRPRRDEPKAPAPADASSAPSSRLGGGILIAGLAILLVAFIAWRVAGGDEETPAEPATTTQATQTTPEQQPLAQLPMRAVGGSKAEGLVQINATGGQVGFTLVARNVEPNTERDAYAVWLTGGGQKPLRLGFAARVGEDRTLATSGPEEKTDPTQFTRGLTEYRQFVVSRETTDTVKAPTSVILRASLASLRDSAAAGGAQGEGEEGGAGEDGGTGSP